MRRKFLCALPIPVTNIFIYILNVKGVNTHITVYAYDITNHQIKETPIIRAYIVHTIQTQMGKSFAHLKIGNFTINRNRYCRINYSIESNFVYVSIIIVRRHY